MLKFNVFNGFSIQPDTAPRDVVKTHQQLHNRRFAGTTLANKRNFLSRFDGKIQSLQHFHFRTRRITEAHFIKLNKAHNRVF